MSTQIFFARRIADSVGGNDFVIPDLQHVLICTDKQPILENHFVQLLILIEIHLFVEIHELKGIPASVSQNVPFFINFSYFNMWVFQDQLLNFRPFLKTVLINLISRHIQIILIEVHELKIILFNDNLRTF